MKLHFGLVAFLFSLTLFSYESPPLSVFENQEINERLKSFYHWPPLAQAMNVQGTKIYPLSEKIYQGREVLRTKLKSFEHPLLEQAQAKALPQYLSWYCKNVLKRISSFFECEGLKAWADFKKDDTVEELARSWVNTVTYDLNEIPLEGSSERPLWSDDFWAMERGLTSYRYAFSDWFNSYREAIESYFQPQEWLSLQNPLEETSFKKILKWSRIDPVGKLPLRRQQVDEGPLRPSQPRHMPDLVSQTRGNQSNQPTDPRTGHGSVFPRRMG